MTRIANYVLDLVETMLGPAEREKRFEWALGDVSSSTGRAAMLPFDAVWEDRMLIVEVDEDQHRESTPHFDKPGVMTVSGVDRGEQRKIYDARKRAAAADKGYLVVTLEWERSRPRQPNEDTAHIRQRLEQAGLDLKGLAAREAKDLSTWALFISLDVSFAIQAAIVTQAASLYFFQHKALFAWNPANMFQYIALGALEERSVVRIAEALKDEHGMMSAAVATVRRRMDLRNHRDALSHTQTIRWKRPAMQEFFDSDKQWTDRRAGLVWDMWRSINERLRELGQPTVSNEIPVGPPHAVMLHAILRASVKPEAVAAVPDETTLLGHLQKFRDDFLDLLVARPDGVSELRPGERST
ncbi:MAG: hypothetical protein M3680_00545 [Myxococcota bacterium]|nr:hypothetical protein [Myxococcota bacterium]